jgi:hypothetical protein
MEMAPSLRFDADQQMWEVTYAGMVRRHTQQWQALVWLHAALAAYYASCQ